MIAFAAERDAAVFVVLVSGLVARRSAASAACRPQPGISARHARDPRDVACGEMRRLARRRACRRSWIAILPRPTLDFLRPSAFEFGV